MNIETKICLNPEEVDEILREHFAKLGFEFVRADFYPLVSIYSTTKELVVFAKHSDADGLHKLT